MPGFALLFQSVAIPFDLDDVGVVQDAVEHRRSEHDVATDGFVPLSKRKVASRYEKGRALVPGADQLEQY